MKHVLGGFFLLVVLALPVVAFAMFLYALQLTSGTPATTDSPVMMCVAIGVLVTVLGSMFLVKNDRNPAYPDTYIPFNGNLGVLSNNIMECAAITDSRPYGRQQGGKITIEVPDNYKNVLDVEILDNLAFVEARGEINGVFVQKVSKS